MIVVAPIGYYLELILTEHLTSLIGDGKKQMIVQRFVGHVLRHNQVILTVDRRLHVIAHLTLGREGHRSAVWIAKRYLPRATALEFLEQFFVLALALFELVDLALGSTPLIFSA